MSGTTLLLVVPAVCFAAFIGLLAWALCVAASRGDAHLESREDELR